MDELYQETKSLYDGTSYDRKYFQRPIAFNVIPQVDRILEDGFTYEEFKIIKEVQKILTVDIPITATAVRVPVLVGHSIALSIELERPFDISKIIGTLFTALNIKLSPHHYTTPHEVQGDENVHVGRIRRDPTVSSGIHLWLCSDNLLRGAATDAVEILEGIMAQQPDHSSIKVA